ncbi:MAG: hypothetical protein L6R39_002596 [Caloplaca ligustica]|nr:MAG: hypothetical protein L6R39_002596 [Caloplaca ligustica]
MVRRFVRPYASAILRFAVSFPFGYPESPPLITFVTDIFHPLVTPLTTYTYTTGSGSSDPVSATDDERLPPGGFGLSDAFPHWFGRSDSSAPSSVRSSRNVSGSQQYDDASDHGRSPSRETRFRTSSDRGSPRVSMINVLDYMRRAFCDGKLLDALPLEAAANPGAWKAWRASRRDALPHAGVHEVSSDQPRAARTKDAAHGILKEVKRPEEWSWDGVWKERVKRGIDASISHQVLFGNGGGDDDIVRFINMEDIAVQEIKDAVCDIALSFHEQ